MFELADQELSKALEAIGCDAGEYWRKDSRGKQDFLVSATDTACDIVTRSWPDWDLELADVPREISVHAHSVALSPFGSLKNSQGAAQAARAMQAWFGTLRTQSAQFVPTKQVLSIGGFLLHRYVSQRENDQELQELLHSHNVPRSLANELIWCSLFPKRGSSPSLFDKLRVLWNEFKLALITAWLLGLFVYMSTLTTHEGVQVIIVLFAVLLVVAIAYALRALPNAYRDQELAYPDTMLERMKADWPGGRPGLLSDPRGYLRFLYDCMSAGLVLRPYDARSTVDQLREALRRCWGTPMNPNYRSAFISHSHAQASLARTIAEGLKTRGVEVGLDAWELVADAAKEEVDQWIVRTVLSSETMIYVISNEAIRSGWVEREIAWEFRLCAVRRSALLPYLILTDDVGITLEGYPAGRIIRARSLQDESCLSALDELAARLTFDAFLRIYGLRYGLHFGLTSRVWQTRNNWTSFFKTVKDAF